MRQLSVVTIQPRPEKPRNPFVSLLEGSIFFFSREREKDGWIRTPHVTGATRGTEFVVQVEPDRTVFVMLDGVVELRNELGPAVTLNKGEAALTVAGQAPRKIAIEALNIVQWWLFYPAVVDLEELQLPPADRATLKASLDAYSSGDLRAALTLYPTNRVPASDAERVFYAALQLAIGEVGNARTGLQTIPADYPPASALRILIAAVTQESVGGASALTASELVAQSYLDQAHHDLKTALAAAQAAVAASPRFSFGWHRVGELQFSFGRNREAKAAVVRALELGPRNAQAHALHGFLLAAENRCREAITAFDQALTIDGGLGNAWLGRGLCRIRLNDTVSGMDDLQTAALMEPNRSLLRAYLGKALGNRGAYDLGEEELELAKSLDAKDPTPWLYSALLLDEQNEINCAIDHLEQSQALNNNRAVYRSQFLLDQDRAVRSAALASIYQRAGMDEVSLREAARAVTYDYANYSAHLFLANSYDALRDPTRFHLRYETPWFNELLLANMLAPVGAGVLSQSISQQEYSRLFEANGIGLITDTRWRSDDEFREVASQFGTINNTSYAFDLDYQHNAGVRPNNELDRIEWYTTLKQQLTSQDSILLLTKYQEYDSGDNFQYYDPGDARPNFRFDEEQSPIAIGGYHHEWNPNAHTLLLGGRLENDQRFSDLGAAEFHLGNPGPTLATPVDFDINHRIKLEIFTAEAQQLFDNEHHTLLFGGRWQGGDFRTDSLLINPSPPLGFSNPAADLHSTDDFERLSAYAYETLKLPARLRATAGLTYEHLRYPENFRNPPIQTGEETRERFNPKASLVWDFLPGAAMRGIYARSLGGVSLDESYRLEPTQLAGFNQDFRTLIPESLSGSVSAPDHEIWGTALDLTLKTRTYIGLQGQLLQSEVRQTVGVFDNSFQPSGTRQHLNYEEKGLGVTVNQLLSDRWALSAQYSLIRSELETIFPALTQLVVPSTIDSTNRAELQRLNLALLYNHPSGFFGRVESQSYFQKNLDTLVVVGNVIDQPDDSFNQLNAFVGFRLRRQRGDITVGVLNVTDQDYRLNPVNPYYELPRDRVFYARLRLRF